MRTALFADIHANREAMEACLAHARLQEIDRYAFLGDLIGYGADPEWVLDSVVRLWEGGAIVILGNHDEAVLMRTPDMGLGSDARSVIDWTGARLSAEHMAFLAGLPLQVEDGGSLYVHADASDPGGWSYIMDANGAARSLDATSLPRTFCGHLHSPALYHQGATGKVKAFTPVSGIDIPLGAHRRWLAVIGAVGQPRDGNPAGCYAIYDSVRNMLTYYRVPFDVEAAAAKIRQAGLPEWLGTRLAMGI